ncbi:uncharacterized protein TNCV_5036491 [Trichonephila clavipes]|nr:uncharacterized protein TNCV_5036491 [Trichonephila clavipes]
MGTRLRHLKTKMRGQKLSDGKPLCGRNRLTEAEIDRLQAYYGLAIRRNLSKNKLSTDEKPQHGFCPSDTDTWCKFKKQNCLGRLIITKIVYLWMRRSASTNRGCYEQNTIVYKTKEVRKEKRLKRKKEDEELLKNADDLEYGAGMF